MELLPICEPIRDGVGAFGLPTEEDGRLYIDPYDDSGEEEGTPDDTPVVASTSLGESSEESIEEQEPFDIDTPSILLTPTGAPFEDQTMLLIIEAAEEEEEL